MHRKKVWLQNCESLIHNRLSNAYFILFIDLYFFFTEESLINFFTADSTELKLFIYLMIQRQFKLKSINFWDNQWFYLSIDLN